MRWAWQSLRWWLARRWPSVMRNRGWAPKCTQCSTYAVDAVLSARRGRRRITVWTCREHIGDVTDFLRRWAGVSGG